MNSHPASPSSNMTFFLIVTGLCFFPFISPYPHHPLTLTINQVAKLTSTTDGWISTKGTPDLEELYPLAVPFSTKQLYDLSGQCYGNGYLFSRSQKQVDPYSFASDLAGRVTTTSNLLGKAQLCFINLYGCGHILGWLNFSLCNYTLNFNQIYLEWGSWSEGKEPYIHKGNFTLC